MKPRSTVSLLLLGAFIPSSSPSPVGQDLPFHAPGLNQNDKLGRCSSPNTCSASYIKSAESRANKSLRQTISTLCSSLQGKYKTVTHSVYTTTTTPKTTIDATHTAARPVATATTTAEVTQQTTDVKTSALVTVVAPREQYPCQKVESLLSLCAGSATPFCSCYESGPTSTTTVTCKGATASQARVTDQTTITPSTSTAVRTIFQTTVQTVTVETGTLVTSTASRNATVSITDIVTTTVNPAPPSIGRLQVDNPASSLNGYYGYLLATTGGPIGIIFSNIEGPEDLFYVDSSSHLNGNPDFGAVQNVLNDPGGSGSIIYLEIPAEVENEVSRGVQVQPICSLSPAGFLSCTETGSDPRTIFQICSSYYPTLVLDSELGPSCEIALIRFVPSS